MKRALACQLALLTVLLPGCSRLPTRGVVGDVSYGGAPIEDGAVDFIPLAGTAGPAVGAPIKGGSYNIPAEKGPLADGVYRVKLVAVRDTGRYPPGPRYAKSTTVSEDIIPEEYNVHSKLQVKIDASANPNRLDFHLTNRGAAGGK